jgi:hypothetical protein
MTLNILGVFEAEEFTLIHILIAVQQNGSQKSIE